MPERPPELLDTVAWERDGGTYSGIIVRIRGDLADILTGHGGAMVRLPELRVIVARDSWDEEALRNHLWAVYGISDESDREATS